MTTSRYCTKLFAGDRHLLNFGLLTPMRRWLNHFKVHDAKTAHRICQIIPAQCPFHRQLKLFGRTLLTIPPLCKLNPLYNELMMLRFQALNYLADECGEDIGVYC